MNICVLYWWVDFVLRCVTTHAGGWAKDNVFPDSKLQFTLQTSSPQAANRLLSSVGRSVHGFNGSRDPQLTQPINKGLGSVGLDVTWRF